MVFRIQPGNDAGKPEIVALRDGCRKKADHHENHDNASCQHGQERLQLWMYNKIQDTGDRKYDDRRTQVIRQIPHPESRRDAERKNADCPLPRMCFIPQPAELIGNKQNDRDLHDLGRLEGQRLRDLDPPPGAVGTVSERCLHQRHQKHRQQITFKRKCPVNVVINLGYKEHHSKAGSPKQCLSAEIVGPIFIGAGTVQHDQAKAHQKNDHQQQIIIKILCIRNKDPGKDPPFFPSVLFFLRISFFLIRHMIDGVLHAIGMVRIRNGLFVPPFLPYLSMASRMPVTVLSCACPLIPPP